MDHRDRLIAEGMAEAGWRFDQLDGVAATGGPGLIGGVIVGVTMGKAIAAAHRLPFLAVNHLEGHALSARLVDDLPFPYLLQIGSASCWESGGQYGLRTVVAVPLKKQQRK